MPGRGHVRRLGAAAVDDAEHVDVEDPSPVGRRCFVEPPGRGDAGGVQREVEPANPAGEGIDRESHRRLVGDVDGVGLAVGAAEGSQRIRGAREARLVAIEQREVPAARGEELRGGEPEAARAACDQCAPPRKARVERREAQAGAGAIFCATPPSTAPARRLEITLPKIHHSQILSGRLNTPW